MNIIKKIKIFRYIPHLFGLMIIILSILFTKDKLFNRQISEKNGAVLSDLECEDCNIVIISLTNTRKDHIGIYGYNKDTTPNIDNFFNKSLIFENTFAPASWTLPVSASLFTSTFPFTHKVMDRYDGSRLEDSFVTLPEILKENGYKTAGITGGGDYNRSFNTFQGFDYYLDEKTYAENGVQSDGKNNGPSSYLGIKQLVPKSLEWLDKNKEEKFFLFLQGFDTHCPFQPETPFDKKYDSKYDGDIDFSTCLWTFEQTKPIEENGKNYWPVKTWYSETGAKDLKLSDRDVEHMISLYDGEIAQTDSYLAPFFKYLNDNDLKKKTVFLFMSEHGDLFGEHGRFMRGGPLRGTFYEPVLNFPLLMKTPNSDKQTKVKSLVQTVDIMPTLLDMLKIEDPNKKSREGKSLVNELIDKEIINQEVYAGSKYKSVNNIFFNGTTVVYSIKSKEWKLIKEEIYNEDTKEKKELYELYKISDDKKELKDLYKKEQGVANDLEKKLNKWIKEKVK